MTIESALDDVRALLRADGGDLELVGTDEGTVHLRLVLEDASCADCVLPKPLLTDVVRDALVKRGADVTSVDIDDPREQV